MKNGTFLSRKREQSSGIGIVSVTAIAQKYDGEARFEADDQIFRVAVVMSNNNQKMVAENPPIWDAQGINNNPCQLEH